MSFRIPWAIPEVHNEEMQNVLDSFQANWLTMGPKVAEFEKTMAEYVKATYAVAMSNGTVALDIALKILGVGPSDEVIVPAMTYIATAAAISYQHAMPVFVDIEPGSFNLDPAKIEAAISPRTRGIIFIDYGGNPADIDGIKAVAKKHNLFLLQDAAQSLGGVYKNEPLGAQTKISTMSFHMAKVMTCVEGGMVFTSDSKVAEELRIRRNQGESSKYLHSHLGTNARMIDICAAIGLEQFKKLPWMLKERRRVAERYNTNFSRSAKVAVMKCIRPNSCNAYFFYPILVAERDHLISLLRDAGIDTRVAYPMPVYQQQLYQSGKLPYRKTLCPIAEQFTARVVNLPIFPGLKDTQIDEIAEKILSNI